MAKIKTRVGIYANYKITRRYVNRAGYVILRVKGHPLLGIRSVRIGEHRFKMTIKLGRKLKWNKKVKEHVHHRDENKENNLLRNLQLLTLSRHTQITFTGFKRTAESVKRSADARRGIKRTFSQRKRIAMRTRIAMWKPIARRNFIEGMKKRKVRNKYDSGNIEPITANK